MPPKSREERAEHYKKLRDKAKKQKEKEVKKQKSSDAAERAELVRLRTEQRKAEFNELSEKASSMNMKIQQIPSDGHCLFRAISTALTHLEDSDKLDFHEVRKYVAAHMQDNRATFMPYFVATDVAGVSNAAGIDPEEAAFLRHCELIASSAEWGSYLELRAAADAFQRPIVVINAGTDNITFGEDHALLPIVVTYHKLQVRGRRLLPRAVRPPCGH